MKITFYSIIMAVFSSGALIGIIYKVRKKACFSKRFGYICIVLMYLLCILRVFMPIDFESTIGIPAWRLFRLYGCPVFSNIRNRKA